MKKIAYLKGVIGGFFMNCTELPAKWLITRKPAEGVKLVKGVKYGDGERETMNLAYKEKREKEPVFIYIHGGGWCSGLLDMRNTYCQEFAARGWFAANIGYQYAPMMTFPGQFKQIYKGIDWLYDHADEYQIDMSKVLLAGESAGGYFIAYMAAMALDHTLYDKLGIEFKHRDDFKVTALISNCGAVDINRLIDSKFPGMKYMLNAFTGYSHKEIRAGKDKDEIKILSPYVTKGFPPTMLIYAARDYLRFESFAMEEQFKELGVPYAMFKGEGIISMHAFPIATIEKRGKECLRQTLEFVKPYFFGDEAKSEEKADDAAASEAAADVEK